MKPLLTALTDCIRDAVRARRVLTINEVAELRRLGDTFIAQELPTTTDDVAAAFADALNPSQPEARSFDTDAKTHGSRSR